MRGKNEGNSDNDRTLYLNRMWYLLSNWNCPQWDVAGAEELKADADIETIDGRCSVGEGEAKGYAGTLNSIRNQYSRLMQIPQGPMKGTIGYLVAAHGQTLML